MHPSDDIEVLGTYAGFTGRTEYLVEESIACGTLLGNVAAARKFHGRGVMYLFGPHCEHPDFPAANRIIHDCIAGAGVTPCPEVRVPGGTAASRALFRRFMAAVSNARIVGLSLERSAYQWLIGTKVYDPEKIRVFLETIWKRARVIEQHGLFGCCDAAEIERLTGVLTDVTESLRELRSNAACGRAEELFLSLRSAAASFVGMYFSALRTAGEIPLAAAAQATELHATEALSAV
jgi:hypothetical protein